MVRNSKLSRNNKLLIYKVIIRPILLYAAPIWRTAAKTNLIPLQRFQNKWLRLILNKDRYTKIIDLHTEANTEYIGDYIKENAQKFYNTQLRDNPLLANIISNYIEVTKEGKIVHKYPFGDLELGIT